MIVDDVRPIDPFKGLLVQSRRAADDEMVGTFTVIDGGRNTRLSSCSPANVHHLKWMFKHFSYSNFFAYRLGSQIAMLKTRTQFYSIGQHHLKGLDQYGLGRKD